MNITVETLAPDAALVCLDGRLDAANSLELKDRLAAMINTGCLRLIVDLERVPFIDSSGLVALVSGLRLARAQSGEIFLSGMQTQAQTVFRLTMLDRVFPIHPTAADAKAGLM
jgi:anti-sigma B factor antagonist